MVKTNMNKKLLKTICKFIDDKSGFDIVCLNISEVSELTDYFIIANAKNERHLKALFNDLKKELFLINEIKPFHADGDFSSHWVLLDYGFVIVHLFLDEIRKFYDIEGLFAGAKEIKIK